jgi:uncharacterized RDD family membrane protein YckC
MWLIFDLLDALADAAMIAGAVCAFVLVIAFLVAVTRDRHE